VRRLARAGVVLAALLLGVLLLGAALGAAGYDAPRALRALWNGSLGSSYALTSSTLVRMVPLALTGLAVALAFRAGVWNIGADGQLLVGAACAMAVGLGTTGFPGSLSLTLALIAGAVGGGAWAWIAAVLRTRFHVFEVITTIMLNFIALDLVAYLVRGPLQEPTHAYPQTVALREAARMPRLLPNSRLHAGLLIAVLAALVIWWVLRTTATGFRIRTAGSNPEAARVAGQIDVVRLTHRALVSSGALAGLAGAIEVTGVTFALYEDISPGYGYTAIAVALLAGLDPLGVLGAAFLFAALESGALAMQREAGVPSVVVAVVEGALILFALVVARPGHRAWMARSRPQRAVNRTAESRS